MFLTMNARFHLRATNHHKSGCACTVGVPKLSQRTGKDWTDGTADMDPSNKTIPILLYEDSISSVKAKFRSRWTHAEAVECTKAVQKHGDLPDFVRLPHEAALTSRFVRQLARLHKATVRQAQRLRYPDRWAHFEPLLPQAGLARTFVTTAPSAPKLDILPVDKRHYLRRN